ncbi:hypothetical protein QKC54_gp0991 [Megavirus baoshan]|uniref:Uncharacterized protein n=1 Tax=Megavirus baoshan TaxID=2496520 RepID=A0A3Q8U8R3_9VIRU|nr:hypothetical protein QKC54_gp0991 [Megavirus baoshan]AZL89655.1 hypothetical protein Mb0081 [Megavirus baoshan]
MDIINNFISQDPNNNFLHYLNHGDNGTKYSLTNQIIALEKELGIPCCGLYLFTKMFDNKIWEIPTNELCEGLIRIFNCLKINKINELAAGNGLLSARLKHYANILDQKIKISTSDGTTKMFGNHPFTYTKVKNLDIKYFNKSEPIIVSWIHSLFEDELLSIVEKYQNDYIFLIGEHPDENDYGNNHSKYFDEKICSFGYHRMIYELKQMSQMDYYYADDIRADIYNENKTCVTFYYHRSKILDIWFVKDLLMKNYPKLFGTYLRKNKEYYDQDKILIDLSNKRIMDYSMDNFKDFNPIIANGFKNYLSIKSRQNNRPRLCWSHQNPFDLSNKLDSYNHIPELSDSLKKLELMLFQTIFALIDTQFKREIKQIKNKIIQSDIMSLPYPQINDDPYDKYDVSNLLSIDNKLSQTNKYLTYGKTIECRRLVILPKTHYRNPRMFCDGKTHIDKPFGPRLIELINEQNKIIKNKFSNKQHTSTKKQYVYKQPSKRSKNH